MPIPEQRDLGEARAQLTSWLQARVPEATDVWVSELSSPSFTGFSNETLLFDAGWVTDGTKHDEHLVARVKPSQHSIFLEHNFDAQYLVMDALATRTSIPVPTTFWLATDDSPFGTPYYVMAKVDGQVPGDNPPYTTEGWLLDATPAQQERLWWSGLDVMADIHGLDWRALGLEFLTEPGRGTAGLTDQIDYYERYLRWATRTRVNHVAEAALEWIKEHRPDEPAADLCWGDSRIGNMIFDDYRCAAVLDWEMVTLGDPSQDLAWWLFLDRHHSEGCGVPRLPGFPSREATVARWETRTGRTANDLDFYEMFAGFRFAVIMMRVIQLAVDYELLPADADMETNNIVTTLLSTMLDQHA
jgi:aminoglycoside phosphotransferase (APT) family kinase protein